MKYIDKYLEKIRAKGDGSISDCVKNTAQSIGEKHLEQFDFISHDKGIVLSSEDCTGIEQVFGIICHAADLGFPLFILLTENRGSIYDGVMSRFKAN